MFRFAPLLAAALALGAPAHAQGRIPSHCIALSGPVPGVEVIHKAAFRDPVAAESVRLNYVGHATFALETPGGLLIATDYTGTLGAPGILPDVATMNHAHGTHFTDTPDPAIAHVLRGWGAGFGEAADHHLDLGEVLIRNVPTDIRSFGGVEENGNSIFVFEVAGLCIGHLGHLHHEPTPEQYAAIGRLDVVMAPVDGGLTLDLPTMIRVLKRFRASVVVPMHWFGDATLAAFLDGMEDDFAVVRTGESHLDLSLGALPPRPTVMVLRPRPLR